MKYDIVTIGDATIDAFLTLQDQDKECKIDHKHNFLCVKYGEKIHVKSAEYQLGGNAANVAVGVSRLKLKSALVAEIGGDEFSLKILNSLAKEHVDRGYIKQSHEKQTSMSIILNVKEDRTIFVQHIEREHNFSLQDIKAKAFYLTSLGDKWHEAYKKVLDYAKENNIKIIFNPGTGQVHKVNEIIRQALKQTQVLFVNKEEAELLVYGKEKNNEHSKEYKEKLLKELQKLGPRIVILTDGDHGTVALDEYDTVYFQEIIKTHVVEKTGAGDSFASGFIGGMFHGKSLQEALLWGAYNSSSVIQEIGAQKGLLKYDTMIEKTT